MRAVLLATTLLLAPGLALAQVCNASTEAQPQPAPAAPPATPPPPPAPAPTRSELAAYPEIPAAEIARNPTLAAIASRGATLRDMGGDTGPLRLVFAHTADRFEVFALLRADPRWVVRGGALLDYGAPDPASRNITLQRARLVPGLVPSVDMRQAQQQAEPPRDPNVALARMESEAAYGTVGPDGAPRVWIFFDPACPFSKIAMDGLRPAAEAGKAQVGMIPVPLLGERSAAVAAQLLSGPTGEMDRLWRQGGAPDATPEGTARMERNRALAVGLGIAKSPTIVWREPDGAVRGQEGMQDMPAVLASVGVKP